MFKIDRVTITGADDSVHPEELVKLSQEFPFVEWGILLSASQEGRPRFPPRKWMRSLANWSDDHGLDEPVHTSGHLCGKWVRDLQIGWFECPHGKNDILYSLAKVGKIDAYPFFGIAAVSIVDRLRPFPGHNSGAVRLVGGLGPDNLAAEIERIRAAAGERTIWIDMETKVRSDDGKRFDLGKVRACLEIAKPWVK